MLPVPPPSPDYIPGPEKPQTPPAPQDEDEHEPIFIQLHDPDFMPKPIYPEDDADDEDEEEEEEEEHLAPADFAVVIPTDELVAPPEGTEPAAMSLPPEAEVERLLAMPTPSPSPLTLLSPPSAWERLARCTTPTALPSPPLPPPLHMPPPIDHMDDVPKTEMPPRKRLCLSTIGSRYEVGESSAARPTGGQGIDYGFVSTLDAEDSYIPTSHCGLVAGRPNYGGQYSTLGDHIDCGGRGICYTRGLDSLDWIESGRTEGVVGLNRWIEKMESVFQISGCAIENQIKFATCTLLDAALTSWNSQIRSLGLEAYSMTWEVLKKKIKDKYCPQGEIKKLEIELWNLKVKENNVSTYTERFQELNLICTKFVADETEKIDKYVSRLPDNIYGSMKASKPKTLDETIELANDLMDQKLRTSAER
nr:reverse transcriptase domain-containing protein [Tanacetum cinerariifolium]